MSALTGIFFYRGIDAWGTKPVKEESWWGIGIKMVVFFGAIFCMAKAEAVDAGSHPVLTSHWVLFVCPAILAGLSDQVWRQLRERERT